MTVEYRPSPLRWRVVNDGRYLTGTATVYPDDLATLVMFCNTHPRGGCRRKERGQVRSQALPVAPWYPLVVGRRRGWTVREQIALNRRHLTSPYRSAEPGPGGEDTP